MCDSTPHRSRRSGPPCIRHRLTPYHNPRAHNATMSHRVLTFCCTGGSISCGSACVPMRERRMSFPSGSCPCLCPVVSRRQQHRGYTYRGVLAIARDQTTPGSLFRCGRKSGGWCIYRGVLAKAREPTPLSAPLEWVEVWWVVSPSVTRRRQHFGCNVIYRVLLAISCDTTPLSAPLGCAGVWRVVPSGHCRCPRHRHCHSHSHGRWLH